MIIKKSEIVLLSEYTLDPLGYSFLYSKKRYIAIKEDKKEYVRQMLSSGLMKELSDKKLFVSVEVAEDVYLENDDAMLLETEELPFVICPEEYSMEMMKTAAYTILQIIPIVWKYGYDLFDPHFSNVVFSGCKCLYCDLGSIVPIDDPHYRYMGPRSFYQNIFMRIMGNSSKGFRSGIFRTMMDAGIAGPQEYYYTTRLLFPRTQEVADDVAYHMHYLQKYRSKDYIIESRAGKKNKVYGFIHDHFAETSEENVKKYLRYARRQYKYFSQKIPKCNDARNSIWDGYGSSYQKQLSDRQQYICNLVNNLHVNNSIELAGNAGYLSAELLHKGYVKKACVTDYSWGAIDRGFSFFCKDSTICDNLFFGRLNVLDIKEVRRLTKTQRYNADIVLALALTHHLILTQKVRLDWLVERFSDFTKRYLIVEFMPLGLWDGEHDCEIPSWYNIGWFKKGLEKRFCIISVEQIEKNRICFLCEKRGISV